MKVKFSKLHPNAIIPKYAKPGDAGMDLTAVEASEADGMFVYKTGLAAEIPEGHVALIFPRSSISSKDMSLANSVGVIDSGYRGEIIAKFRPHWNGKLVASAYQVGDRIAQMIIIPFPQIETEEVPYEELTKTERGKGGFGSSGA